MSLPVGPDSGVSTSLLGEGLDVGSQVKSTDIQDGRKGGVVSKKAMATVIKLVTARTADEQNPCNDHGVKR